MSVWMIRTGGLLLFLFAGLQLKADSPEKKQLSLSGYVRDASNGEVLIGATVYLPGLASGTATNAYGYYSLSALPGTYRIQFSYLGYRSEVRQFLLENDTTVSIELEPASQELLEFEVVADRQGMDLRKPEMSTATLPMKRIRQIPAMMGEVDLIKAVQLLPGVQSTSEGSSSFSVRGGSGDQNLILLDEATVYNASHLMGFFSVFNNDAINSVKIYKGDIPVWAGGSLASLLDIRMKEGNSKYYSLFRGKPTG